MAITATRKIISAPLTSIKNRGIVALARDKTGIYMGEFPSGQRGQTVNLLSLTSVVRIHLPPPTKNALLSTKTKVRFLNDVCLRQMMLASPMMTASPNDAWLRHILWQTSHHFGTKWSNIVFAKQMHHIAAGDASFKNIQGLRIDLFAKV